MDDRELDFELFDDDICDLLMQSRTTRALTEKQLERLLDQYRKLRKKYE